jgi:hypothetical protein
MAYLLDALKRVLGRSRATSRGPTTTDANPGRLHRHDLSATSRLGGFSAYELGCELLARLQTKQQHATNVALQSSLAMLNALSEAVDEHREVKQNRLSLAASTSHFDFVQHCWRHHGLPILGAVHLDIGSGPVNPYARMFTHLMAGARRTLCLELDPVRDPESAIRFLARLAAAALIDPPRFYGTFPIDRSTILANLQGFDLAKLQRGEADGVDPRRIELLQRPIETARPNRWHSCVTRSIWASMSWIPPPPTAPRRSSARRSARCRATA